MGHPVVLIADDDPGAREFLALALRREGYVVRAAADGLEALVAMEVSLPDVVVSDLNMPGMDGRELVGIVQARWPDLPVIVVTVAQEVATVVDVIRAGAVNFLVKPASAAALVGAVERAVRGAAPRSLTPSAGDTIVGATRAIATVRRDVARAARSDVNVLIVGATGTGKELVARAIHAGSRFSRGPFVAHNCAATPHDLFESTFFGHRRGSFTGADRDHAGLLLEANGGVLLLDELEALAPAHQAKLLRVLDDGEVRPVGGTESRRVTVRVLAALNREPAELLSTGSLREDLYYRLRGDELRLPLLCERLDDIALLADHFLRGGALPPTPEPHATPPRETATPQPPADLVTPEALALLCSYSWPGNVRELRNAVETARAQACGEPIRPEHLPPMIRAGRSGRPEPGPPAHAATLLELERRAIAEALREHGGNRSRAADALGVDRSTLRRKLRGGKPPTRE